MIGQRLYELRKRNNWPLQYVADQLGIAKSTYAGYESGYREPSLETVQRLATLLNVTSDYLLGRTEEPVKQEGAGSGGQAAEMEEDRMGIWFKELLDAPEERREELRQIWEIIKQREAGRTPGKKQGES